jgi:hypothetical protein
MPSSTSSATRIRSLSCATPLSQREPLGRDAGPTDVGAGGEQHANLHRQLASESQGRL